MAHIGPAEMHKRISNKGVDFKCPACPTGKLELMDGLQTIEGLVFVPYKCDNCGCLRHFHYDTYVPGPK